MQCFAYLVDLSLSMRSFNHSSASGVKYDVIFEFITPFYIKTPFSTRETDTVFGHFCDDNVCADAVSTLLLLLVLKLSPEMHTATSI